MKGLISAEDFKREIALEESFTRQELAMALSEPENNVFVSHVQVTRDIQSLYAKTFARKPIPYDVAVELYLIRLFRKEKTEVYGASYVSKGEIREFIDLFEKADDEYAAKWAYAARWGGGKNHFESEIVNPIRRRRLGVQPTTIDCSFEVAA